MAVFGEVTPLPPKHVVRDLVRKTLDDIGYTQRDYGTSGQTAHIEVHLSGPVALTSRWASIRVSRPSRTSRPTISTPAPATRA